MTDLIVLLGVVVAVSLMCALGAVLPWDDGGLAGVTTARASTKPQREPTP